MVKRADNNGRTKPPQDTPAANPARPAGDPPAEGASPERPAAKAAPARRGNVAKVSHTLSIALAERLEEFAFFQRVSESAVIEHSLAAFFAQSTDDMKLGEQLRRGGAGRRRKG